MKKKGSMILGIVVIIMLLTGSMVKAAGIGGTIGYTNMDMSDTRDWLQDLKDYMYDKGWVTTLGNFKSDISYGFEGKTKLGRNLALRLRYSHLSGGQTVGGSNLIGSESAEYSYQISIQVIMSSLILIIPSNYSNFYYGGVGVGYYLPKFIAVDKLTSLGTTTILEQKGEGNALGFHGFLGSEFFLGKNFSISLEALYRVARIPYLKCTENTVDPSLIGKHLKRDVYKGGGICKLKDLELDFSGLDILTTFHIYF